MQNFKIKLYRTNLGLCIRRDDSYYHHHFDNIKVNGISPQPLNNNWFILKAQDAIITVEVLKKPAPVLKYWELEDQYKGTFNNIPELIKAEGLDKTYDDDLGKTIWVGEYSEFAKFYKPFYEEQDALYEEATFDITDLGYLEIDNPTKPESMKVTTLQGDYAKKNTVDITSLVHYEEFEKMLTPEFMLHTRPCVLPSQQMYAIVRNYIKDNINPSVAKITSDYNFCFNVKRIVTIKPVAFKTEIHTPRGNSYKPPRFKDATKTTKEVDVFEMTHALERYKGYTPIAELKGDNLQDLFNNLKAYLEDLMQHINSPLEECKHCNGTGHIWKE